ncbi:hypothetical protein PIB30_036949 [Stylosanthes scabra]|uniref:Uncharacterized protein n=1 Tax=Stylosanthes scabra TaxID=79078 RepID=A0ABU6VFQ0_9FABA|nr:hypothetical protein [Stylosanthes scabra]
MKEGGAEACKWELAAPVRGHHGTAPELVPQGKQEAQLLSQCRALAQRHPLHQSRPLSCGTGGSPNKAVPPLSSTELASPCLGVPQRHH